MALIQWLTSLFVVGVVASTRPQGQDALAGRLRHSARSSNIERPLCGSEIVAAKVR